MSLGLKPYHQSHSCLKTCFTIGNILRVIAEDSFLTFLEGGRGKPPFFMSEDQLLKNVPRVQPTCWIQRQSLELRVSRKK